MSTMVPVSFPSPPSSGTGQRAKLKFPRFDLRPFPRRSPRNSAGRRKTLLLIAATLLLILHSSCSHVPKTLPPGPSGEFSSAGYIARSLDSRYDEDRGWIREEQEWLLTVLIVLGIAAAASAAIWVSFGPQGLLIKVRK